jgi:hypothetical protein
MRRPGVSEPAAHTRVNTRTHLPLLALLQQLNPAGWPQDGGVAAELHKHRQALVRAALDNAGRHVLTASRRITRASLVWHGGGSGSSEGMQAGMGGHQRRYDTGGVGRTTQQPTAAPSRASTH